MTNQEILEKAIQKAIDGRWNVMKTPSSALDGAGDYNYDDGCYALIFNNDFAKALWGEEPDHIPRMQTHYLHDTAGSVRLQEYQYHLQQMVIADDPIKYLGENI